MKIIITIRYNIWYIRYMISYMIMIIIMTERSNFKEWKFSHCIDRQQKCIQYDPATMDIGKLKK